MFWILKSSAKNKSGNHQNIWIKNPYCMSFLCENQFYHTYHLFSSNKKSSKKDFGFRSQSEFLNALNASIGILLKNITSPKMDLDGNWTNGLQLTRLGSFHLKETIELEWRNMQSGQLEFILKDKNILEEVFHISIKIYVPYSPKQFTSKVRSNTQSTINTIKKNENRSDLLQCLTNRRMKDS